VCIEEAHRIVYRDRAPAAALGEAVPVEALPAAPQTHTRITDPVLLFRFSALTFNAHRIHYDADYARGEEGYPGLVVHAPLLAVLAMEPLRRAGSPRVTRVAFDALHFQTLTRANGAVALRILRHDGSVAFEGVVDTES
jgi:3-methylfumaryl-CoA hydratase